MHSPVIYFGFTFWGGLDALPLLLRLYYDRLYHLRQLQSVQAHPKQGSSAMFWDAPSLTLLCPAAHDSTAFSILSSISVKTVTETPF